MTNREACEPCARRKVRCDKREPCSNCKRRKTDRCIYPSVSPADRIKRLEALVRNLGGNPNISSTSEQLDSSSVPTPQSFAANRDRTGYRDQSQAKPFEFRSTDPIVLEENGQSFYLESRGWQGWIGNNDNSGGKNAASNRNPFLLRKRPHALSSMLNSDNSTDSFAEWPSHEHASILWHAFINRVEPFVRTTFRWVRDSLRTKSTDVELRQQLSKTENALVSAIFYISVSSLADEECRKSLQQPRSSLLSQYQAICEESLLRTNLLCMNEIVVMKAIIFYMMASYDRLSTQSLWSLMGLTIRNAEKLGLHRDGLVLGLSPLETEERRRVWWQLQHVDLCLGVWSCMTPITLMADWDSKIPSNIEDEDIHTTSTEMPKERKGLTSISYCRFTWWILDKQRQIFQAKQGRFALSWQLNHSLSPELKEDVITQLEDGLNQEFLQYCDPLKPLDTLLQLVARALIVGMRMRVLHASVFGADLQEASEHDRLSLTAMAMQCLKYGIACHSQPSLKQLEWYTKGFFSWHAFMFVLVEAARENDVSKAQEMWDLLASVYTCNASLYDLEEDRRRLHAAELVVAAWKAWQNKFGIGQYTPPQFVIDLENGLASHRTRVSQEITSGSVVQRGPRTSFAPITPESFLTAEDMSGTFDLDFQDIDWSFWNSMD